jgi:leucyl aminopeptidase
VSAFKGTDQETLSLYPEKGRSKRLLLVGLGKSEKLTREKLRRAAATAARSARSQKATTIAFMEPEPDVIDGLKTDFENDRWLSVGLALSEGAVLALYRFDPYLTEKKKNLSPKELILVSRSSPRLRALQKGLKLARVLCESTYLARDLENAPGNEIFPESLARRAVQAGRSGRFRVTVYDERKIRRLKMGGLLGVGQGSDKPPRFITMEYRPRGKRGQPTVVLVGKGVTFDSGGISIKPAANMAEMKMDMSGAAAVIGTMLAAARLRLPVRLVGLIPAAENLLGGAALKPGDIITHYNGKTSEIDNTDAEGRLILADALSYASRYKPNVVIDLATLTGACVVALGHHATGMMGNNQEVMDRLKESGERTHERVWQLPMFEEYDKLIKSDIADVKNVGGRWAGAITGAMFLKKFIGNYRWVHLDIAGTAILEESLDYIPKGGSGVGVRLLVDLLQNWK